MPLYSAGSNSHGQLAHQNQLDAHRFQPCQFTQNDSGQIIIVKDVHALAFGANHTLALCSYTSTCSNTDKGEVWMVGLWGCGSNQRGQLGPLTRIEKEVMTSFVPIPLSGLLACVSEQERRQYGIQLAPHAQDSKYSIVSIACAWQTSFVHVRPERPDENAALGRTSDFILAFGANDWNERGRPSPKILESSPINIIPFNHNSKSSSLRITSLVSGPRHVLAIVQESSASGTSTSRVLGWGASRHGQVGPVVGASSSSQGGNNFKPPTTLERPCELHFLDSEQEERSIGSSSHRPVDLAVGRDHSIVLFQNRIDPSVRYVALFGSNKQKQIQMRHTPQVGEGSTLVRLDKEVNQVCASWTSSFFLHHDGTVHSFGSNTKGQLGRSDSTCEHTSTFSSYATFPTSTPNVKGVRITFLATGSEHVLAQEGQTGDVWGWGWNEHGNLGLSHTEDVRVPEMVWSAKEKGRVRRIWCGNATSFVLVSQEVLNG
ncbi:BQ2448_3612 [Microbotryum intermedium]|uniref:BQ2448_3612 protein n=1 Tax=Microbotryum intermedium TaxID=269621 RepID=A0A238FAH0_9BASI|nr:BQ2448_3612 [Microbotryum intermedium]